MYVRPNVNLQCGFLGKVLTTELTMAGPNAIMLKRMFYIRASLYKIFFAHITVIGLKVFVDFQMQLKIAFLIEFFATNAAQK